jgi:hypothetical protein
VESLPVRPGVPATVPVSYPIGRPHMGHDQLLDLRRLFTLGTSTAKVQLPCLRSLSSRWADGTCARFDRSWMVVSP